MHESSKRLVPLSRRGKLAAADGDLRGWWVFSADGDRVGRVHELIVHVVAMEVVFLDVLLSAATRLNRGPDDLHVLAAVHDVRLHGPGRRIIVESLTAAEFAALPRYRGCPARAGRACTRRVHIGPGVRLVGGGHERGRGSSR